MSFWAYLLRCSDESFYVGHTDDLEQRIAQHGPGELVGYTYTRRPVELVWAQDFPTRYEALTAERQIKGWSRVNKEALIAGNWDAVSAAARKPSKVLRYGPSTGSGPTQDERVSERANTGSSTIVPRLRAGGAEGFAPPPAIVLVRPQLGENIGKTARAMLNFGLTDLRLVAPRDGWPNPDAGPAASGADGVLEGAQVFASLAEAIADCAHVYATTVRKRGVTKPVVTPDEAAATIRAGSGRSAVLFGPERSGLATDDVAVARTILTVPINPRFGSLNLAQAVILVAYEWSKHAPSQEGSALASPPKVDLDPPAPQAELDGMIGQLETMLEDAGYFYPPDRVQTVKRMLRSLLTKPGWDAQEVRTLRGVFSQIAKPHPR